VRYKSGRIGQWQYCFSVTLDKQLNDALLKYCQENNCYKAALLRALLAKKLGIEGYEMQKESEE